MNAHALDLALAADLAAPYVKVAVYYDLSDTVEYVRFDDSCIYRRIDERLTLALDIQTGEVIGFRLKGFKNLYLRELKPMADRVGIDFVTLVSAFTLVLTNHGDLIVDQAQREAYRQAIEIAANDNVKLSTLALAA